MSSASGNLRNQLLRLQQVGMVRERVRLPELEYIFKHTIVQEVTYGTLLTEQRRQLHRRAAEMLEQLFPERREELAGSLALHYAAAGENSKAIPLFVQAARRAEEVYAYEEALQFLLRARELKETEDAEPEGRMNLLEHLADIHFLVRESLEAFHLYQDVVDLHQSQVDADKWTTVRLHRKICEAWIILPLDDRRYLDVLAQANLKEGLRLTDGEAPHLEAVRLLVIASHCVEAGQNQFTDLRTAKYYAQAAVEMAEQLDAPVELSSALDALGTSFHGLGLFRDYLLNQQRRQRLSHDAGFDDLREKLDILNETAQALKMVGDYAQATPLLLEAEVLGEQIRDIFNHSKALWYQAECWMRLDRWDEVLVAEEKIMVLQRRYPINRLGPICWLLAISASVHAYRGEEEMGTRLSNESYAIMLDFAGGNEENWHRDHYY
jgi:hypothetical protein